jgi:hypothetical protein
LNLQGIEYIRKIENLLRVPLGRNRARPSLASASAQETTEKTGHGSPARGRQRGSTATSKRLRAARRRTRASTALVRGGWDGGARSEASGEAIGVAARGARLSGRRTRGYCGGGRGAVGSVFKPPHACLHSVAHGSQSELGAV